MALRIDVYDYDAIGNIDMSISIPYKPGDSIRGRLKRLLRYLRAKKTFSQNILRQEHGWRGDIRTKIVWRIDGKSVEFKEFYSSILTRRFSILKD